MLAVENIVIKMIAVAGCKVVNGRRTQVVKYIVIEAGGVSAGAIVNQGRRKICRGIDGVVVNVFAGDGLAVSGQGKDITLVIPADVVSDDDVVIMTACGSILDKQPPTVVMAVAVLPDGLGAA